MVGSRSVSPQSNASGNSAANHGNRDRCLSSRLGCPTSGVPDRGAMVNRRETDAYQCVGAAGNISCPKDLCHRQITFECASSNGQHVSQSLHKPFGGTHSHQLNSLAVQMWKSCLDHHIFLTAEHLPGWKNQIADKESRVVRDCCDWMIHPNLFSQIRQVMGPREVDLFASRLTHQLPRFFSWRPDPLAEATDAFTQDWSQCQGYANPPWCLILRTLSKIQREEARVLLIVPVWRTQPWYPLLLQLLVICYPKARKW